jgi:hypothetical protein
MVKIYWVASCDHQGGFVIPNVPPGHDRLDAWHEVREPLQREDVLSVITGSLVFVLAIIFAGKGVFGLQ